MHHRTRLAQLLLLTLVGFSTAAVAEESSATPPSSDSATPPSSDSATAAPSASGETPASGEPAAASGEAPAVSPVAATEAKSAQMAHYGLAARWRWVTVPGWFLGLFATKNVPLSTFNCFALEGFWRKHDKEDPHRTWEIVVAVGYQNMTPPDGFWLGRGKQLGQDTDLVQVRGLGLVTMDAAYVLRQYFSPYFGIHYGAGLGLGVVRGKVLRTSAVCDATGKCHVEISQDASAPHGAVSCGHAGEAACTEVDLAKSEGTPDNGPIQAHRFQESAVPSALPIINLLFGLDFPIPDAKGLEFRLEGGFYDAFFIGATAGYAF